MDPAIDKELEACKVVLTASSGISHFPLVYSIYLRRDERTDDLTSIIYSKDQFKESCGFIGATKKN